MHLNLLEPKDYLALFAAHPPLGFICPAPASRSENDAGLPIFFTPFDLLTTLETPAKRRIQRLPLYGLWSKALVLPACFGGATITEYAPLPARTPPGSILNQLLEAPYMQDGPGRKVSLTILKDLPEDSPLLTPEENALAADLAALAEKRGFISLEGQALAYVPVDFASIDEYLGRLSTARRKDMRRKLKSRRLLKVERAALGDAIFDDPAFCGALYSLYLEVFQQSAVHFDLLSPEFFAALLQSRTLGGVVFLYRHAGELVGFNLCLLHAGRLIDKYIGLKYPQARNLNLYFISWFVNLEFALEQGLSTYVAGWTDPEVKASLGASFTFTRHLAWVRNPLLRRLLRLLRRFFQADAQTLQHLQSPKTPGGP